MATASVALRTRYFGLRTRADGDSSTQGFRILDQTLASGSAPDTDGRDWKKILLNYRDPDTTRSIIEIVTTVVPLIVVWAAAWASLSISYLLTLVFIIPASLLVLRLFMIQHDCGHGAFFHGRLVNDWVGRIIGIVTLTPYDVWRRSHAVHHATSGNLDLRGVGDIDTLTVDEYRALPRWRKLAYRLYRNPIVMFVIGPAYLFLLQHRLPIGADPGVISCPICACARNSPLPACAIVVTIAGVSETPVPSMRGFEAAVK